MAYPNGAPLTFTQGPVNVDEILATTLSLYYDKLVDNIYMAVPTLNYLKKKGKKTVKDVEGVSFIIPIKYRKNSTAKMYSYDDILDTTSQNNYTSAQFLWKQSAVTVKVVGLETLMNSSKQKIIDLVKARLEDAETSGQEMLSAQLFNQTPGSKDLVSLPILVDAISTVGDINSSAYSWWQANVITSGSFSAQGLADARNLCNTLCQYSETDLPDFVVTTQTIHQYYENTLQPQERFMSTDVGDAGFMKLQFKSMPIVWDPSATAGVWYNLNSRHVELTVGNGRDFLPGKWIEPENQDTRVCKLLWAGALFSNERRKNGKMTNITA